VAVQKTLNERVDEFRRDLDQLGKLLDQIRREYDLFFAGARKRQPYELRMQIDRLMKKWRATNIQKLELTFRLTTLQSRYAAQIGVWDKILKRRESDPHSMVPFGPTAQHISEVTARDRGEEPSASSSPTAAERAEERRQQQAANPDTHMRGLFDQFVDAKRDMGETIGGLSYDKFKSQLDRQVVSIREKTKCKDVKFNVIRKNGKVSLTAKPVRD